MSEHATNSAKGRMDCDRVSREEIFESYLLGRLTEQDREAFEQHYFECARCFDELQTLQAIRDELRRGAEPDASTTRSRFGWPALVGLAAAVIVAVGVAVSMRPKAPSNLPEASRSAPPSPATIPETSRPDVPEPPGSSESPLELLARVEPPRYEPPVLRGTPDDVTARFQRGMDRYRQADYRGAINELRPAADQDPAAAHIRFYLGISQLMLGQDDPAIDSLRATIALGDSAYLEDAHWYLAKAFLRRKDSGAAERQLKEVIKLSGTRSSEARRLLNQLERLKSPSP
jgi:tetratricopeptide repeat protein